MLRTSASRRKSGFRFPAQMHFEIDRKDTGRGESQANHMLGFNTPHRIRRGTYEGNLPDVTQ